MVIEIRQNPSNIVNTLKNSNSQSSLLSTAMPIPAKMEKLPKDELKFPCQNCPPTVNC